MLLKKKNQIKGFVRKGWHSSMKKDCINYLLIKKGGIKIPIGSSTALHNKYLKICLCVYIDIHINNFITYTYAMKVLI